MSAILVRRGALSPVPSVILDSVDVIKDSSNFRRTRQLVRNVSRRSLSFRDAIERLHLLACWRLDVLSSLTKISHPLVESDATRNFLTVAIDVSSRARQSLKIILRG